MKALNADNEHIPAPDEREVVPNDRRAYFAAYRAVHREKARETTKLWRLGHSEQSKVNIKKWQACHVEQCKAYTKHRYVTHREQEIEAVRQWRLNHPNEFKSIQRKQGAKRRALGFVALNTPFPGCEGHHLDKDQVVYIPQPLHKSVSHNVWTGRNMERINAVAMQWVESHATA